MDTVDKNSVRNIHRLFSEAICFYTVPFPLWMYYLKYVLPPKGISLDIL